MGEKLFRAAGMMSMMAMGIVLVILLTVLIIASLGGWLMGTAVLDALSEIMELTPMPY